VLGEGEVALSDPLFFRPGDAADPPQNAAEAVAKMFGSLAFSEKRIGLFWETYGVAPGDTIDVAIHVINIDKPGFLRRIGSTLGIAGAEGAELTIRWREPRPSKAETVMYVGDVPVQSRGLVLDVNHLRPGRYTVELTIAKVGGSPVTTRRDVTFVK
jgi:hypothetical protein